MAAPKFLGQNKEAKATAVKTDTRVLEEAAMIYAMENNDVLPKGIELPAEDLAAAIIVNNLITAINTEFGTSIAKANLFTFNEANLIDYVKNTSNDIVQYVIVDGGTAIDGMVFKIIPVKNKAGNDVYGSNLIIE